MRTFQFAVREVAGKEVSVWLYVWVFGLVSKLKEGREMR